MLAADMGGIEPWGIIGGPEGGMGCDMGGVIMGGGGSAMSEESRGDFLASGDICVED